MGQKTIRKMVSTQLIFSQLTLQLGVRCHRSFRPTRLSRYHRDAVSSIHELQAAKIVLFTLARSTALYRTVLLSRHAAFPFLHTRHWLWLSSPRIFDLQALLLDSCTASRTFLWTAVLQIGPHLRLRARHLLLLRRTFFDAAASQSSTQKSDVIYSSSSSR